jgi:hypothetical protein
MYFLFNAWIQDIQPQRIGRPLEAFLLLLGGHSCNRDPENFIPVFMQEIKDLKVEKLQIAVHKSRELLAEQDFVLSTIYNSVPMGSGDQPSPAKVMESHPVRDVIYHVEYVLGTEMEKLQEFIAITPREIINLGSTLIIPDVRKYNSTRKQERSVQSTSSLFHTIFRQWDSARQ